MVPAAQPWTSLATSAMCQFGYFQLGASWLRDLKDASRSYYIVRTPGPDGSCNTADDVPRALRLGMGAADAPLTVDEPVSALYAADQSLTGLLVRNGRQVRQVDANFANPRDLFQLENAATPAMLNTIGGYPSRTLVFRDGDKFFGYQVGGSNAPVLLFTLAAGETVTGSGFDSSAFLALTQGSNTRLVRIDTDLSMHTLANVAGGVSGSVLMLSPSRAVFVAGTAVLSVPRAGGAATTLTSGSAGWLVTGIVAVSGERAYVTAQRASPYGSQVRILATDGSASTVLDDTGYLGAARKSPFDPSLLGTPAGWSEEFHQIQLVEQNTSAYNNGGRLRAYDGATGALAVDYGPALPASATRTLNTSPSAAYVQVGQPWLLQVVEGGRYGLSAIDILLVTPGTPGWTRLSSHLAF